MCRELLCTDMHTLQWLLPKCSKLYRTVKITMTACGKLSLEMEIMFQDFMKQEL